jgi:O-methyltransferase involved in polyketide biosynthesis
MKEKVKITGVPETMIQTLYARAKETQKNNAKIKDDIAVGKYVLEWLQI